MTQRNKQLRQVYRIRTATTSAIEVSHVTANYNNPIDYMYYRPQMLDLTDLTDH